MPAEAIFPQEYFVYYKGKWCTAGGKDPLFGHVDGFQIDLKILKKDFNQDIVLKTILEKIEYRKGKNGNIEIDLYPKLPKK